MKFRDFENNNYYRDSDLMNYDKHFSNKIKDKSFKYYNNRVIFHIDFDYFFAQCEELRNPKIKKIPVIVCVYSNRTTNSGVVSTCNYIARRYSIRSGMPIKTAKAKIKDLESVFLPLDKPYYQKISSRAMKLISNFSSKQEIIGLDECFVDFTDQLKNSKTEESIKTANMIKEYILNHLSLTCSIGISYNKLLAKIASKYNKPNNIFIIDYENSKKVISDFNISFIPGIGEKMKKLLYDKGIKTFEQLSRSNVDELKKEFGQKTAIYIYNASRGINDEKIEINKKPKQYIKIKTIKYISNDFSFLNKNLIDLIKLIYDVVCDKKILYREIGLILITQDFEIKTHSKKLKLYSNHLDSLISVSSSLLNDILRSEPSMYRRIGIKISDLKDGSGQQTLFDFE
ncbi:MAG: Y-family DNA polymerase [Nitrososphaeraceae archaeon]